MRLGFISTYNEKKQKVNAQSVDVSLWGLDLEDIEKGGKLLVKKTVGERKAVGDKTVFNKGDILYSKLRPYLLKILVAPDNGICTPEIVPFTMYGNILPEYVVYFLKSPYVDGLVNGETYGIKMPRAGTDTIINLLVPLPPLSEQNRIAAKIEQLLPYIEKYEQSETQLTKLSNDFPEFLKKSILQEAVQGKLVPQDPSDEPASVLLERIRTEKQKLIKAVKIKKDKHESIIVTRDKIPYEIPESWVWCKLADLGEIVGGGTPKTNEPDYWTNGNIPWLTPADMKFVKSKFVSRGERFITEKGLNSSSAQLMPKGTILYSSRAPIGYIAIAENDICTNQGFKSLVPVYMELNQYLYYCLIEITSEIISRASGTTFKEISGTEFGNTLIPLPPLSEQHRIVAKIEELMPFINTLSK